MTIEVILSCHEIKKDSGSPNDVTVINIAII